MFFFCDIAFDEIIYFAETATISQLLAFRALAKNLTLLTNHDNVVQMLHMEVNEGKKLLDFIASFTAFKILQL